MKQKSSYLGLLAFLAIVSVGILLQFTLVINDDNYWLLQVTGKFLQGGRYYKDFIETNPPMILYLYSLPVIISHLFHWTIYTVFRLYIITLALLSTAISYYLLKLSTSKMNLNFCLFIVCAMIAIFLFLLPNTFGQREQITLILIMPYLLLTNNRLSNETVNFWIVLIVGIMAGIGFSIKPHFLIPLILIEFTMIIKQKNFFTWIRTETITIALILIVYLVSIFIIAPEYIVKIVPFCLQYYYIAYPFFSAITFRLSPWIFWLIISICFILLRHKSHYKNFLDILFIACVGFIIVYFIQRQYWAYHYLPAYALMTLLSLTLLFELLVNTMTIKTLQDKTMATNTLLIAAILAALMLSPFASSVPVSLAPFSLINQQADQFIKTHTQHKTFYLFSCEGSDLTFLTAYAHGISVARPWNSGYLLLSIDVKIRHAKTRDEALKAEQEKQFLIDFFVKNINEEKPDLIIFQSNLHNNQSPLLQSLLTHKNFSALFRAYHPIGSIKHWPIINRQYQLIVYQREKSS